MEAVLLFEVFSCLGHDEHVGLYRPYEVVYMLLVVAYGNDVYSAECCEYLQAVVQPVEWSVRTLPLAGQLVGVDSDNQNIAVALGRLQVALVPHMEEIIYAL